MNKAPRKKIGLPLSQVDEDVINKNLEASGIGQPATDISAPKPQKQSPQKSTVMPRQAPKLSSQDLRCYIAPTSKLAAALSDELGKLEPKMRSLVPAPTILRKFLQENDETLAKLFRESNALS